MTDYGNGIDECVLCKENVTTGLCEKCEMSFHVPPPLPVFILPQYEIDDPTEITDLITKKLDEIGFEIDMFPPRHPFRFHGLAYEKEKFTEFHIDLYSGYGSERYIDFQRRDGDSFLFYNMRQSIVNSLGDKIKKKETKWRRSLRGSNEVVRELFPLHEKKDELFPLHEKKDELFPEQSDEEKTKNEKEKLRLILLNANSQFQDVIINIFEILVVWSQKKQEVPSELTDLLVRKINHSNSLISRLAVMTTANLLEFSGENVSENVRKEIAKEMVKVSNLPEETKTKKILRECERAIHFL